MRSGMSHCDPITFPNFRGLIEILFDWRVFSFVAFVALVAGILAGLVQISGV